VDQPVAPPAAPLDGLIRRDRAVALAGLLATAALGWLALIRMAGPSSAGAAMAMPSMTRWHGAELTALVAMWAVMMVAMMLPGAAPMILLFAGTMRRRVARREPAVPTAVFLLGYLLAWTGFSVLAGSAEWALHGAALVSPATMRAVPPLAGVLLVAAGVFQWTPLKRACLAHCRSPLHFLSTGWRDGAGGALAMGVRHGLYCVGCCWLVMALLFVAGVMNLAWVAVLAAFVLVEKVAPAGDAVGRAAGVLLVGWGGWLLLASAAVSA
jgi:predicted metal-binding membrane protein